MPTNHLRGPDRIDSLNIHFNKFSKAGLIKIKGKVVEEVEVITDNDESELVGEFGFFEFLTFSRL